MSVQGQVVYNTAAHTSLPPLASTLESSTTTSQRTGTGTQTEERSIKKIKMTEEEGTQRRTSEEEEEEEKVLLEQSLLKFKKTTEEEIRRLRREGVDVKRAINSLVDKIRSDTSSFDAKQEDIDLVMKISGNFNEADAIRTLIVREELVKLRQKGYEAPQAVEELIERIRSLIGIKRRNNDSFDSERTNESPQWADHDDESDSDETSELQEQRRLSSPKRKKRKHKIDGTTEKEPVVSEKEPDEFHHDATSPASSSLTNSAYLDNMSSLFISEEEQVPYKRRAQHDTNGVDEFDAPKKKLKSKNVPDGSVVL